MSSTPLPLRHLVLRCLLVAAVLVTLLCAMLPPFWQPVLQVPDYVQHATAFAVLTLLTLLAFPTRGYLRAAVSLAIFGAVIEVVQALPVLARQASLSDWLVDCGAIVATCLLVAIKRGDVLPSRRK